MKQLEEKGEGERDNEEAEDQYEDEFDEDPKSKGETSDAGVYEDNDFEDD